MNTKQCEHPNFQHSYQRLFSPQQRRQKLVETISVCVCVCVCVRQNFGTTTKDYSIPGNGTKNLLKTNQCDHPNFQHNYQRPFSPRQRCQKLVEDQTCEDYFLLLYIILCNKTCFCLNHCKFIGHTSNKVDYYHSHKDL